MNIGTPLLKGQLGTWLGPTSMYRAPSLKKVRPAGAQRRRQVCQLLSTAMDERLVDAPLPVRSSACTEVSTSPESPKFSSTSTSPHFGQPTVPMLAPIIHQAGQVPSCGSSLMRASKVPWYWLNFPSVLSRALRYAAVPCAAVLVARITRFPFPSRKLFSREEV